MFNNNNNTRIETIDGVLNKYGANYGFGNLTKIRDISLVVNGGIYTYTYEGDKLVDTLSDIISMLRVEYIMNLKRVTNEINKRIKNLGSKIEDANKTRHKHIESGIPERAYFFEEQILSYEMEQVRLKRELKIIDGEKINIPGDYTELIEIVKAEKEQIKKVFLKDIDKELLKYKSYNIDVTEDLSELKVGQLGLTIKNYVYGIDYIIYRYGKVESVEEVDDTEIKKKITRYVKRVTSLINYKDTGYNKEGVVEFHTKDEIIKGVGMEVINLLDYILSDGLALIEELNGIYSETNREDNMAYNGHINKIVDYMDGILDGKFKRMYSRRDISRGEIVNTTTQISVRKLIKEKVNREVVMVSLNYALRGIEDGETIKMVLEDNNIVLENSIGSRWIYRVVGKGEIGLYSHDIKKPSIKLFGKYNTKE